MSGQAGVPESPTLQIGARCKMCGATLVGEHKYYMYLRQMRQVTSGHHLAEICMACIGDVLLEDPKFMAKLMASLVNNQVFLERAAESMLGLLKKVKQGSKDKPPEE